MLVTLLFLHYGVALVCSQGDGGPGPEGQRKAEQDALRMAENVLAAN